MLIASPFAIGMARVARRFGVTIAEAALPAGPDGVVDLAAAPRRTLVVTLQLAILLVACLPLVAITQPFLPGLAVLAIVVALLLVLGVGFWRSAADLQGHVRAGAAVVVEALAEQAHRGGTSDGPVQDIERLLVGLGKPVPVALDAASPAVGKTLAALDLRGLTGATVLAIARSGEEVAVPTARRELRAGDVLALAGTADAIAAAEAVLRGEVSDAR